MLLTLRTTHRPATDLGYLLGKNPARVQTFALGFGQAHVFYPEADEAACTAALLLDVDPVARVRGRKGGPPEAYVNDRAYVASSYLSVAIAQVLRSALSGTSRERPETAAAALPLEARLSVVRVRGGEGLLRALFEPLGYAVEVEPLPLEPSRPEWGEGSAVRLTLRGTVRLAELLSHLYVLIPVLDGQKHYWVGDDEVEKLLRAGAGWLNAHPAKDAIARRYLKRRESLVRQALTRLVEDAPEEDEDAETVEAPAAVPEAEAAVLERRVSLNAQRMAAVLAALRAGGARRVLDLGCGAGQLLRRLLDDSQFAEIVGVDVSPRALELAEIRLKPDRMPPARRARIRLLQGALTYRDRRLEGFDAAALVEVVEHLDPPRLAAFERAVFHHARPGTVVLTTPNAEYNVRWESLPAGTMRHRDHRFEWTRAEFRAWADGVAARNGYTVRLLPVGPEDGEVGAPTQMAVFTVRETDADPPPPATEEGASEET